MASVVSEGATEIEDPEVEKSEVKRKEALALIEASKECESAGDSAGAKKALDDAWRALEESLALCPTNHRARFLLVSCAMNADDYARSKQEALLMYESLSPDQLNDSVLNIVLAHSSKMLGEVEDAIFYADEATRIFPDDPQPYMIMGEIYEAQGQDEDAEHHCRQALRYHDSPDCQQHLNPKKVYEVLCCLSASLIKQGKFSEAEFQLLRATKVDPSQTLALRHLVDTYHFQGRKRDAMDIAQQISRMDPDDTEILNKMQLMEMEVPSYVPSSVGSNTSSAHRWRHRSGHEDRRLSNGKDADTASRRSDGRRSIGGTSYSSFHDRRANAAIAVVHPRRGIDLSSVEASSQSGASTTKSGRRKEKKKGDGEDKGNCFMCCMDR